MYLRNILLENIGPIERLEFQAQFADGAPKPIIFVGSNGSGKSIALSYLVNFFACARARVFEDTETPKERVFKVRSGTYIRHGGLFSHAKLQFAGDFAYEEWVLPTTKADTIKHMVATKQKQPNCASWNRIKDEATDLFDFQEVLNKQKSLETEVRKNVLLYLPPNRFEEPAWLNEENLNFRARFHRNPQYRGKTLRRMIKHESLAEISDWFLGVALDLLLEGNRPHGSSKPATALVKTLQDAARLIFRAAATNAVEFQIGSRNARALTMAFKHGNNLVKSVPNIFTLSTGESLLLGLVGAILRDADLCDGNDLAEREIQGIAIIDEIDAHLHVDLQQEILPKLLRLFPKVQFILTTHSPLFLLGMEREFGSAGFSLVELPSGRAITTERFREFEKAYASFKQTRRFESDWQAQIQTLTRPCLLTEGKTDALIIKTAWEKLNPGKPIPFDAVPPGIDPDPDQRIGGAEPLRRMLEYLGAFTMPQVRVIGLFDHDHAGYPKFNGLHSSCFEKDVDGSGVRKHMSAPITALLLPAPPSRTGFCASEDVTLRFMEIEHYFSDEVIDANSLRGSSLPGSPIFKIADSGKVRFAESVNSLSASEFENFKMLFERLSKLGLY